jgi:hypothetical protein
MEAVHLLREEVPRGRRKAPQASKGVERRYRSRTQALMLHPSPGKAGRREATVPSDDCSPEQVPAGHLSRRTLQDTRGRSERMCVARLPLQMDTPPGPAPLLAAAAICNVPAPSNARYSPLCRWLEELLLIRESHGFCVGPKVAGLPATLLLASSVSGTLIFRIHVRPLPA